MRIKQGDCLPITGGTMTGDIDLAAHKLLTTNLSFYELDSGTWNIRNRAAGTYKSLSLLGLYIRNYIIANLDNAYLAACDDDGGAFLYKAKDSGVGLVTVARDVGAADPYRELTLPARMLPGVVPGAVLEGMFGYNDTTKRVWYRDNAATRILGLGAWKQGTFTNDTTEGDQAITGVGFQPELLIVWCLAKSYSLAITDGTNLASLIGITTDPIFDLAYLAKPYTDGSNFIAGKLKQFDVDGFTITWETLAGTAPARTYAYLAWRA